MIDRGADSYSLNFISNCTIFICYMVGNFYYSCFVQTCFCCTWFCLPSYHYIWWFGNILSISLEFNIVGCLFPVEQVFTVDLSKLGLFCYSCWIHRYWNCYFCDSSCLIIRACLFRDDQGRIACSYRRKVRCSFPSSSQVAWKGCCLSIFLVVQATFWMFVQFSKCSIPYDLFDRFTLKRTILYNTIFSSITCLTKGCLSYCNFSCRITSFVSLFCLV